MLLQDDEIMDINVVSDPFEEQTPAEDQMETTEEVLIANQIYRLRNTDGEGGHQ